MYLLDTSVIAELGTPSPDPRLVAWFAGVPADSSYLSAITIGEIATRIAGQRSGNARHADELQAWLDRLRSEYAERLIPVDAEIAARWGALVDAHPAFPVDMLIAATAIERHLILVTRNGSRVRRSGVPVIDPSVEAGSGPSARIGPRVARRRPGGA